MHTTATQKLICILLLLSAPILVFFTNYKDAHEMVKMHQVVSGDQAAIYQAFKTATEGTIPSSIQNGWMPVGYMALIGFYHKISNILFKSDIYSSFIYHGLIYTILTAFMTILLMYRVAKDESPTSNSIYVALGCFFLWFSLFRLSAIMRFNWLPWSHYSSAFIGILFCVSIYEVLMRKKFLWMFICSFSACLFFYTRRHEAIAIFSGTSLLIAILIIQKFKNIKFSAINVLIGLVVISLGIFTSLLFIKYFSFGMPFNSHYSLQRQLDSYINEYMKLYPKMIPIKLIQTFFDPNFYSYGNLFQVRDILINPFGPGKFSMPLIFQLPILWFLLPLSVAIFVLSLIKFKLWKTEISPAILMFLLGSFSFSFLVCGYLSAGALGGAHLKNGLVREFILAVTLLSIATGPALFLFLGKYFSNSKIIWLLPLTGIILLPIFLGEFILPRNLNWITFPSTHISQSQSNYILDCRDGNCDLKLNYKDLNGKSLNIPFKEVILNLNCNSGVTDYGITLKGESLNFSSIACKELVKVEVYPILMGYASSGHPFLSLLVPPTHA